MAAVIGAWAGLAAVGWALLYLPHLPAGFIHGAGIPQRGDFGEALYISLVTLSTVGFGDIVPKTDVGRAIASVMMLLGWSILAVPTGIVTAEMTRRSGGVPARRCPACGAADHLPTARFCHECAEALPQGERI